MLGFVAQNVLDATMAQWQARDLHQAWQPLSSWTCGRDPNMARPPRRCTDSRRTAAALAIVDVASTTEVTAGSSSAPTGGMTAPASGKGLTASDFFTAMKAPGPIALDACTRADDAI